MEDKPLGVVLLLNGKYWYSPVPSDGGSKQIAYCQMDTKVINIISNSLINTVRGGWTNGNG